MTTAFVANVGNRDVTLNIGSEQAPFYLAFDKGDEGAGLRKYLNCAGEGARALAAHVRAHLTELRPRLAFPILGQALALALAEASAVDLVVLIATDQPESAGPHRAADTVETAGLLQACLAGLHGDRVGRIVLHTASVNPSLHDVAFDTVGEALRQHLPPSDAQQIYISVKGGVPAMNAALREQGVGLYGPRLHLIDVQEPDQEARLAGRPGTASFRSTWAFRREGILRMARVLLARHDYEGLRLLLEAEVVPDPTIHAFLRHAHARLNLDFAGADAALEAFRVGRAQQWRLTVRDAYSRQRLLDVAWAARASLGRQDFVGFLARVATFCENCQRQLVFTLTDLRMKRYLTPRHVHDRGLRVFLEEYRPGVLRTDRDLYTSIVTWWLGGPGHGAPAAKGVQVVRERIRQLRPLEDLRNEMLHSMHGVSREDIEEALPEAAAAFQGISDAVIDALGQIEAMLRGRGHTVKPVYEDLGAEVYARLADMKVAEGQ
jgi:hypothetical protein